MCCGARVSFTVNFVIRGVCSHSRISNFTDLSQNVRGIAGQ